MGGVARRVEMERVCVLFVVILRRWPTFLVVVAKEVGSDAERGWGWVDFCDFMVKG